ncbi:MAG TPA: hypothetical protein ENJ00_02940 [Phycisphaerales bacterium]|nr:hypothetical protein [Phycisphaerales bacterium]
MELVLVRHGQAEPVSESGKDEDRRLTPLGERQAAWIGAILKNAGFARAHLISSPAIRTRQTSEKIAEALDSRIEFAPGLMLGRLTSEALGEIEARATRDRLVVVGHNPPMSDLASMLAGGIGARTACLRTGEAACFHIDDPLELIGPVRPARALRLDGCR